MNCEKCGHEMLVAHLSEFYTEYECPICGHRQIAGDLAQMAEDEREERTTQEEIDLIDTFRLALIELERLAYVFGPGSDERYQEQIERCRQLRSELAQFQAESDVSHEP